MIQRSAGGLAVAIACLAAAVAAAGDMSIVPFFNGERADSRNTWGGVFSAQSGGAFFKQTGVVRTGQAAYAANIGSLGLGASRFFQTFSSGVSGTPGYRQDRDLTRFEYLDGYIRNDTGAPLTITVELKDYRDSSAHSATRDFALPAGGWTQINAPLDFSDEWNISGSPDFQRTFAVTFKATASSGPASGSLYFDDFAFRERGPVIDVNSADTRDIVERLAERQFSGLWHARSKTTGLVPDRPDDLATAALNTTTGVVWLLPSAVRRGWVDQAEADGYMTQLVNSLNVNRNQTNFLPTRFLDFHSAAPRGGGEESTIDASFIALALHKYKTLPTTPPALRDAIDNLENRFEWPVFAGHGAFGHGYRPSNGISPFTYSGYTNENKVIALAAALSDDNHVPLASNWNGDTGRQLAFLTDPNNRFLVYSYSADYRAPFVQALLNLFVDVSDRGVDSYPIRSLARSPWLNYVQYEDQVAARLDQLGRDHLFQPDAGGAVGTYQPWNLFEDFGHPEVFQPWSVALALLAGAPGADEALRFLLDNGLGDGLDGPLGFTDSARWLTGSPDPFDVPSYADNWNMTLSTMAFMEYLDRAAGQSEARYFADLPAVDAALDTVFVEGDLNGNGVTNAADLAIWRAGFGTPLNASPAIGDADGDGAVDGRDLLRWQRGLGSTAAASPQGAPTPEPGTAWISGLLAAAAATRAHRRPGGEVPKIS